MFKIIYDDGSQFLDLTTLQSIFEFHPASLNTDNWLYVGMTTKRINSLFFNVSGTTQATLEAEYYDGSTWQSLTVDDYTLGFFKPNLVQWTASKIHQKFTIGSVEGYFYRFRDSSAEVKEFKGINSLFSTDDDLVREYPTILRNIPEDQTSFVRFHESSRDEIVTDLRNTGKYIKHNKLTNEARKQLDQWDLLDISEVRQASKYLTLSKIFNYLSDEPNDRWGELAANFRAEAGESLTPLITIDENQDGIKDDDDLVQNVIIVGRL